MWRDSYWGYYGRAPLYHVSADQLRARNTNGDPARPSEEPEDGCPGGWYRTRFARALLRYRRRRAKDGQRSANAWLDGACELVREAVDYYEAEEDAAAARFMEAVDGHR